MTKSNPKDKELFITLLESSIEKWLSSRCESSKSIKIKLNGEISDFLKGKIKQIILSGNDICFKEIKIDKINLETEEIGFQLNLFKRKFLLKKKFGIFVDLVISDKSIRETLFSKKWEYLRIQIAKEILCLKDLNSIKISNNNLEINGIGAISKNHISYNSNKIIIKNILNNNKSEIPIDKNIEINEAGIVNNQLVLSFNSSIQS